MNTFENFMLWFLTIVVAVMVCDIFHLHGKLKESEERLDKVTEAISTLYLLKTTGSTYNSNNYPNQNNDGILL